MVFITMISWRSIDVAGVDGFRIIPSSLQHLKYHANKIIINAIQYYFCILLKNFNNQI